VWLAQNRSADLSSKSPQKRCCQLNDEANINACLSLSKKGLGTKGVHKKTPVITGVLKGLAICFLSKWL